jgi:hypothetical protein
MANLMPVGSQPLALLKPPEIRASAILPSVATRPTPSRNLSTAPLRPKLLPTDSQVMPCGRSKAQRAESEGRCLRKDDAVKTLKTWMFSPQHVQYPYPNEQEKLELMQQTGLTRKQLTNWFTNSRKRLWQPVNGASPIINNKKRTGSTSSTNQRFTKRTRVKCPTKKRKKENGIKRARVLPSRCQTVSENVRDTSPINFPIGHFPELNNKADNGDTPFSSRCSSFTNLTILESLDSTIDPPGNTSTTKARADEHKIRPRLDSGLFCLRSRNEAANKSSAWIDLTYMHAAHDSFSLYPNDPCLLECPPLDFF